MKKYIYVIFALAISMAANPAPLSSNQWIGPVDVFTTQIAQYPVVGVDAKGNAVILATASDDGSTFYEKGAQLVQGVIQNVHNFPPIDINTSFGGEFQPVIAVNAAGYAAGLWTEYDSATTNDFVRAVLLTNNVWGFPTTLTNPVSDNVASYSGLGITLDNNNNAISAWCGQNGTTLESSQYMAPVWSAAQQIPLMSSNPATISLAANPSGQSMLAWISYEPYMYASYYNGISWITQLVSGDVFSTCRPILAVSLNAQNNAMLIWNNASVSGISSTVISGDVVGSVQVAYTPAGNETILELAVSIDNFGNAIALWTSQIGADTYQVMTSRYAGGGWGVPLILGATDSGNSFSNPNIATDGFGNAYAVWEKDDISGNGTIFYNQYTNASNSWLDAPVMLSAPSVPTSNNPKLSMNQYGGAAVVWNIDPDAMQTIQIVYVGNQKPNAPLSLAGKQIKNKFATQTDIINEIRWLPSLTPSIVSYNIFRNGNLIAIVPSTDPLVYRDHNRCKREVYTYEVTAVNAQGIQSDPAIVVIR